MKKKIKNQIKNQIDELISIVEGNTEIMGWETLSFKMFEYIKSKLIMETHPLLVTDIEIISQIKQDLNIKIIL